MMSITKSLDMLLLRLIHVSFPHRLGSMENARRECVTSPRSPSGQANTPKQPGSRHEKLSLNQHRHTSSPTPTCRFWAALSSWRKISKVPLLLINADGA